MVEHSQVKRCGNIHDREGASGMARAGGKYVDDVEGAHFRSRLA
jgi:hypothetical protein